jgi:hypothetical protein
MNTYLTFGTLGMVMNPAMKILLGFLSPRSGEGQ